MGEMYDHLLKVVVVGDSGVGKSSLLKSWVGEPWSEGLKSTVGVDFVVDTLEVDGKVVKMQMWDTAGQEKFRSLRGSYYRGAHCAVVVYDITCRASFNAIKGWVDEVCNAAPPDTPLLLVGNKADLQGARAVAAAEGEERAEQLGCAHFFEVSARTERNVRQSFQSIAATSLALLPMRNDSKAAKHLDNALSLSETNRKQTRTKRIKKYCKSWV